MAMMQDRVRRYPYQRLPTAASIRLIRVLPGRVHGSIVCSLQTVDSPNLTGVEYQALSYLWGDPKPTRKIYVRDENDEVLHEHHLHENLWQFLDKWQQPRTQPSGLLWTDSLCLNQNDSDEKGQQIRRMGKIYSGANEVIMWLGPDTASMAWTHDWEAKKNRKPAWRIRELPYWSRAWIVQEVALAQRALVTCGDISLELDEFQKMRQGVFSHGAIIWDLCDLHREKSKPLWWILKHLAVKVESTIAVDIVFGLFGLVSPNEDGSSPIDYIRVDYARRPVDLLFDALFEACPPLHETRAILHGLERSFGRYEEARGIRADAQALDGYLRERGISERHVQLASLALHVYEANRVAAMQLTMSFQKWREITEGICVHFSLMFNEGLIPAQYSFLQHAAFVGFSLALDCQPPDRNLETQGLQRQAYSWLCLAHSKRGEDPEVVNTVRAFAMFGFDRMNLARLCAGHSLKSSCDVSRVEFDMPDIGFRMTAAPLKYDDRTSGIFEITLVCAGTKAVEKPWYRVMNLI